MITALLEGCLGNAMSQVAAAYVLALDNNDECAFNLYDREEEGLSGHGPSAYKTNIYSKLKELPKDWQYEFYYPEPGYDYVPIPYHPNMAIHGYFVSEKHINHRRNEVIDLFKDKKTFKILKGIVSDFKNSVSLHVRRGDYINRPTVHPFLKMDYYRKALGYIENRSPVDKIYLFTEDRDVPWCKANFRDNRIVLIEGLADYMTMYLMSLCTHNIIANSSFSSWGSYLNENPDKIVVSSKTWHGPGLNPPSTAFFCDNWVLIENEI